MPAHIKSALTATQSPEDTLQSIQRWVETMVIGLNLCPFASQAWLGDRVRCTISTAGSELELLDELQQELALLSADRQIETTLLVHPHVLQDFLDFNDFLDDVDALLEAMQLTGTFQVASFHPHYRFARSDPDDVGNYTNRAPYPILHLLREDSVTAAVASHPDPEQIPRDNVATLEQLGLSKIQAMLAGNDQPDS